MSGRDATLDNQGRLNLGDRKRKTTILFPYSPDKNLRVFIVSKCQTKHTVDRLNPQPLDFATSPANLEAAGP
jgi:hypothetical protein